MPTLNFARSSRIAMMSLSSLALLAACPGNGNTDTLTTTDTTGAASTTGGTSTTSEPVTTSATTDGTSAGTVAETGTSGPLTTSAGTTMETTASTATTTTAATATDEESSAEESCNMSECEPCPEGCTPKETCELGTWVCECLDCPPEIACVDDPPKFPEFDESCAVAEDCAIVFHQIDCCGSQAAWGVNTDVAKSFGEAEAVCMMQYPQCDCPTQPTIADDGNSAADAALIEVQCNDGQCFTVVP